MESIKKRNKLSYSIKPFCGSINKLLILIAVFSLLATTTIHPVPANACASGDMNGDGQVTVADALLALQIATGLVPTTASALANGDVNGDGIINATDALLILRRAVGLTNTISGAFTYSNGAGIQAATVTASTGSTCGTAVSDSKGNYSIPVYLNGAYTVAPTIFGNIFNPTSLSATVNGTNVTGVNFTEQSNILPITVNGSLCSSGSYTNKPCVSVTICSPGTSTCQTINDILLDTGSYGLRILNQAMTVPLTQVASGSGQLAECVQFGDGSSEWGPVQMASVILGNEPAVQIPVHVVNQSFGVPPSGCNGQYADTSPTEAGFNGILGVGLFGEDCGSICTTSANNPGYYYACTGSTCTVTTVPDAKQVINPVAALPADGDNNGVLVLLPSVALGGVPSVSGGLIIGIGTQTNNQPATATGYPADPTYGEFTTSFGGNTFTDGGFIDSGSNGLYFDASTRLITQCSKYSNASGYFCPSTTLSLSATNSGYTGSPSGTVNFEIGNVSDLFNTSNNVFSEFGGYSQGEFDWGLPFFFGKEVFVGIEGTTSSLGTGPYWAY